MLRTWLKVENEAELVKAQVQNKPKPQLYDVDIIEAPTGGDEEIAYNLMQQYRKDPKFIDKDISKTKAKTLKLNSKVGAPKATKADDGFIERSKARQELVKERK